ncbi:hypothetical protein [Vibrio phage vB_VmeM-Yong XC32]|nr:hypothetical protein [Vibrio phage vB_VmeM-Yong XC31]QAX96482.1 hypothetical protein [Vibrio phage vB_VmeM-Yong XC32]QAX96799.1 hypothetical protein [Vibrio phage vB_VmeM-Yong MS31]QAX97118.1 hypothetical protein [Vibrio phage vB_VmeM-Yong MS32]
MSIQTLYKYQFDKYGNNSANLIPNEPVKFDTPRIVPFVLREGNFYQKDLTIRDKADNSLLVLGTDYNLVGLDADLTAETGLTVAGGIELADKTFIGELEVTYRCVGGPQGESRALYLELIEAITNAGTNPSVLWESIIGRPQRFPPEIHSHLLSELTELEKLYQSMQDMTNAIVNSKPMYGSNQNILEQIEGIIQIQAAMQLALNRVATGVGSVALINQVRDNLANVHKQFDKTTNTVGVTWADVAVIPEADFNNARGVISIVDATDSMQMDFDISWTTAKDPSYTHYGHIGTDELINAMQVIKQSGNVVVQIRTTKDATVKTKFTHLL